MILIDCGFPCVAKKAFLKRGENYIVYEYKYKSS